MKDVLGLISGVSTEQVDVIVAVIGFIGACIVAIFGLLGSALTILFTKRSERKVELRKIKESHYIDFLKYLAEAMVAEADEKHKIDMLLSERVQTILLIGNIGVQTALQNFLGLLTDKKMSKEKQNILYAKLIEAMKKDLYGKCEDSLGTIEFTVFGSKSEEA